MKLKQPKVGFVLLVMLIPMVFSTTVNTADATSTSNTDVDILFAGDEETMNAYIEWPDPIWWWLGVFYDRPLTEIIEEDCFPSLQKIFAEDFGINLVSHGESVFSFYSPFLGFHLKSMLNHISCKCTDQE